MTSSDTFAHLPQNSAELERAVLGVMLTSATGLRDALGLLTADTDFYHLPHQPIFRAIQGLHEAGMVDYLTLNQQLAATGQLRAAGGAAYVRNLLAYAPTAAGSATTATSCGSWRPSAKCLP